jgi:hypothetical protein
MKTYSVKIERTVYSDKNYEIKADNELEASEIAEQLAEDEWIRTTISCRSTFTQVAPDWEYGYHTHESVYEEEYEE